MAGIDKIKVTFDNDSTEEKEIDYECKIDKLSTSSSLKELIDRQEQLDSVISVQRDMLRDILISKNIGLSDDENKLSVLISKVSELGAFDDGKLWLYKNGDLMTSVTGGWSEQITFNPTYWYGGSTIGKLNSDHIYCDTSNARSTCSIGTTNTIDLSGYKKIMIRCSIPNKSTIDTNNLTGIYFFLDDTEIAKFDLNGNSDVCVHEIDISNINQSIRIFVGAINNGPLARQTINVYEIWLEK